MEQRLFASHILLTMVGLSCRPADSSTRNPACRMDARAGQHNRRSPDRDVWRRRPLDRFMVGPDVSKVDDRGAAAIPGHQHHVVSLCPDGVSRNTARNRTDYRTSDVRRDVGRAPDSSRPAIFTPACHPAAVARPAFPRLTHPQLKSNARLLTAALRGIET